MRARLCTVLRCCAVHRVLKENKAQCLSCGDIIVSKSVHDFVRCSCKKLFVDGGLEYARRGYQKPEEWVDLSTYEDE